MKFLERIGDASLYLKWTTLYFQDTLKAVITIVKLPIVRPQNFWILMFTIRTPKSKNELYGLSTRSRDQFFNNIPRACLLNRSPVGAMDLKSNRSGLWLVAELVAGWEDYVASVQTVITIVKLPIVRPQNFWILMFTIRTPKSKNELYGLSTRSRDQFFNNIPRACLLNRSPVGAMDLKSNRSGLWLVAELVAGWEDYVASVQTMSHNMIKLQLSQYFCRATKIFCRATWASCRVGVTLCCDFYTFRTCNTCTFSVTTFAVLRHTT